MANINLSFKEIIREFPAIAEVLQHIYLDNGGNRQVDFSELDYPTINTERSELTIANQILATLTPKERELLAMDGEELYTLTTSEARVEIDTKVEPVILPFFDGENSMFVAGRRILKAKK